MKIRTLKYYGFLMLCKQVNTLLRCGLITKVDYGKREDISYK